MAISRYVRNVGRSVGYAFPQVVRNRMPSVAALVGQMTDSGQREDVAGAIKEIGSIIKDDVFGLLKKGVDNATKELKTGKFYQTEDEQFASMGEFAGGDFDMSGGFDDSLLGADASPTGSGASTAAAAAYGAAKGVEGMVSAMRSDPNARATAEATIATARYGRAQIGTALTVGNMLRGAVMANAQYLSSIHRFQTTVQHSFYRESLERATAQMGLMSEMVERLGEIRENVKAGAVASDQMLSALSGRESDFTRVFDNDGGFNAGAYARMLAGRTRGALADGLVSQFAKMVASAPLTKAFEIAADAMIPKNLRKQMDQFGDFVGSLGTVLNERMRAKARTLGGSTRGIDRGLAKVLEFFSVSTGGPVGGGPDLSNIVRGKAVAFDGYAHRSLVEVIPSHLADIHAELVAMRRARGIAEPTDRKLYDFKTGRFASEKRMRAFQEANLDRDSLAHFDKVGQAIGDDFDPKKSKQMRDAFRVLRDQQFSIKAGDGESLRKQLEELAASLRVRNQGADADALAAFAPTLAGARDKNGSKLSYQLQAAIAKAAAQQSRGRSELVASEGASRMMYSGVMVDPRTGAPVRLAGAASGARSGSGGGIVKDDDINYDSVTLGYGAAQGFAQGHKGSIFRDASGKVTARSVLRAPVAAVSKMMESFENRISDFFFGEGDRKGVFARAKDVLMGDVDEKTGRRTGVVGRLIDTLKFDVFGPVKKFLVGDKSDPASMDRSLFGKVKKLYQNAMESAKGFLFGKMEKGADGEMTRQGGLFGGIVRQLGGAKAKVKEFLLGSGEDGKRKGILVSLREKFGAVTGRIGEFLFGKKSMVDDGFGNLQVVRDGGLLPDLGRKMKELYSRVETFMKTRVFDPMARSLFGEVGADGKRTGGLFGGAIQRGKDFMSQLADGFKTRVMAPMGKALFGEKYDVEQPDGTVKTMRKGGFFPELWKNFKLSVMEPMAEQLMGKKGPDGKRQGGALRQVWGSIKDAFAPLKEAIVGKDGLWPAIKRGVSDTMKDLRVAFFGDGPQKSFGERVQEMMGRIGEWLSEKMKPLTDGMKKAGDWLRTKVVEPFGKWLNDPKTGVITRMTASIKSMSEGLATRLFGEKESFVDEFGNVVYTGKRKGGLFGSITAGVNRFFYGDPANGTPGFVDRVVKPAKEFLKKEIWEPIKASVSDMWERSKKFVSEELIQPMKGVMEPFIVEIKNQWRLLKEWAKGPLWDAFKGIGQQLDQSVKGAFGSSLSEMLRKNVLDPIKDALGSVKKFMMTALSSILKMPVNIVKGLSDDLKASQIRRGLAGKLSAEERERVMAKYGIDPASVPAGSGSSVKPRGPSADASAPAAEGETVAEKRSWRQRMRDAFRRNSAPAASQPAQAGAAPAVTQTSNGGAVAAAGVAQAAQAAAAGEQKAAESGRSGLRVRTRSVEDAVQRTADATTATADNTSNLYQFVSKHLHGVGKNVERIVQHFRIRDTELGGNSAEKRSGIMGKIRQLLTSPVRFFSNVVSQVFDGAKKIVKTAVEAAQKIVMVPLRLLGKTIGVLKDAAAAMLPLVTTVMEGVVAVGKNVMKAGAAIIKETAKAVGGALSAIASAVPKVTKALTSAAIGILKTAGTLASEVAKIAGSITVTLVKVGATMLKTAASVAKDVVTGLANVTFSAIRGLFGGRGAKTGSLTPVYVVGGYLAGTEGGASTMAEAQAAAGGRGAGRLVRAGVGAAVGSASGLGAVLGAGLGFFSPEMAEKIAEGKTKLVSALKRVKQRLAAPFEHLSAMLKGGGEGEQGDRPGTFSAIRSKMASATSAVREGKWKTALLDAQKKGTEALTSIRSGFSKFGSMLLTFIPMIGTGIAALTKFFTEGKFIQGLLSAMRGGPAAAPGGVDVDVPHGPDGQPAKGGKPAAGAKPRGRIGRAWDATKSFGSKVGGKLGGMGKFAKVGLGLGAGIAGSAISSAADGMDDGIGKRAVKTGGAMLQYGAMGAMFGPVGIAAGAALGAIVENWDVISDGAGWIWDKTKEAGSKIAEASGFLWTGVKEGTKALWSEVFGNGFEIDEKTGKVTRQEKSSVIGRFSEMLLGSDEKRLQDGQIVKEGGLGIAGNLNNMVKNLSYSFGKLLTGENVTLDDFVRGTSFEGLWGKVTGAFDKFVAGFLSVGESISEGFSYITEGKFVDDIKSGVKRFFGFGGDEKAQGDSVVQADNRSLGDRVGSWLKDWGSKDRSQVGITTVGKDGKEIRTGDDTNAGMSGSFVARAAGGPLGKAGTLVGELGPEMLDGRGNVISGARTGGMFGNPAAVQAAQEREGSITSILTDIAVNTAAAAYFSQLAAQAVASAGDGGALKDILSKANSYKQEGTQFRGAGQVSAGLGVMDVLKGAASAVGGAVSRGASALGGALSSGYDTAKGVVSAGVDAAKGAASSIAGKVSGMLGKPAPAIVDAIKAASGLTGADFGYMMAMAGQESGFNPDAKASTSSASGLYQFIDGTWKSMVQKFGSAFGIKESDRSDPKAQAIMAGLYSQENAKLIEPVLGRKAGPTDLYLSHFLGGGGAKKFLAGMSSSPDAAPAEMGEFASQANANKGIFYSGTKPRSFKEIYDLFQKKIADKATGYASAYGSAAGGDLKTAMFGGALGDGPTLVGERQPEVLTPDGMVIPSVDQYLKSSSADVSGLAVNTAIKEAMRRAGSGSDESGASDAISKVMSAAGAMGGGATEELLKQMVAHLAAIAGNTGRAVELAEAEDDGAGATQASAPPSTPSPANVFALSGSGGGNSRIGMSESVRRLVKA